MKNVNVFGAKGGVGTTTIAAALAMRLVDCGLVTTIRVDGNVDRDSISAVCGLGGTAEDGQMFFGGRLRFASMLDEFADENDASRADVAVTDYGSDLEMLRRVRDGDVNILVVRNEYLGLRRTVKIHDRLRKRVSGVVMINEPGRALGRREVADVLEMTVWAQVPVRDTIARAIDAGVLMSRMPDPLKQEMDRVVATMNGVLEVTR